MVRCLPWISMTEFYRNHFHSNVTISAFTAAETGKPKNYFKVVVNCIQFLHSLRCFSKIKKKKDISKVPKMIVTH